MNVFKFQRHDAKEIKQGIKDFKQQAIVNTKKYVNLLYDDWLDSNGESEINVNTIVAAVWTPAMEIPDNILIKYIMYLVGERDLKLLKKLFSIRKDIDISDRNQVIIMTEIIEIGKIDLFRFFIEKCGFNPTLQVDLSQFNPMINFELDIPSLTYIELAEKKNKKQIVSYLRTLGVQPYIEGCEDAIDYLHYRRTNPDGLEYYEWLKKKRKILSD